MIIEGLREIYFTHSLSSRTKISTVFSRVNALIAALASSGLQASIHPPKDKKERAMREGERERA